MAAKKKNKCKMPGCWNKVTGQGACSSCRSKASREKDPHRYSYTALRNNAKRRRKPFNISLEDFKEFCYETKYIETKGRSGNAFSVDCIIDELEYDWESGKFTTVKRITQKSIGPF